MHRAQGRSSLCNLCVFSVASVTPSASLRRPKASPDLASPSSLPLGSSVKVLSFSLRPLRFYSLYPPIGVGSCLCQEFQTPHARRLTPRAFRSCVVCRIPCVYLDYFCLLFFFIRHVQKVLVFFNGYILLQCTGAIKLYNTSGMQ